MGTIGILIIVANIAFTYLGLSNYQFFEQYKFHVGKILYQKDYKRLVTSGFLHADWMHLFFNMFSLYSFSNGIENYVGPYRFIIIYFGSLVGADLLTLYLQRRNSSYTAVGASGAVCGIIFSAIALYPGISIGLMFIPFAIPGWLFGLLYMAYSIYGMKSKRGNIGHEAHFGGAFVGLILTVAMYPSMLADNYPTLLLITVPSAIMLYLFIERPKALQFDKFLVKKPKRFYTIDEKYNEDKIKKQKEIDRILDKVRDKGMHSLTIEEREKLK